MSRMVGTLLLVATTGACNGAEAEPSRTLTVFAASSLREAFEDLGRSFEEAHPGTDVSVAFAGSQILRLQIEQGAPADVYASADRAHMSALVQAGLVEDHRVFAHNELVVIVPRDDPAGIERFDDLPRAERLVIGDETVPVGRYTREMLGRAAARRGERFRVDVLDSVVSQEAGVRLLRAKVELGAADAAIVYRTDAASSDHVRIVPIPDDVNVRADYHVGVVSTSERRELARQWIAHATGEEGRRVLSEHGFVPAP